MLELAEEFPVLKKAYQWDSFLQEDEPGKEGRDLRWRQSSFMLTSVHRTPKQYDPTDLPPPERFEIWVYLCQRPNALRQPVLCEIYTDLDIVGQFHVGAVDPNLDRAIKDIFIRAFKPIEDLNQKAGKQSASK